MSSDLSQPNHPPGPPPAAEGSAAAQTPTAAAATSATSETAKGALVGFAAILGALGSIIGFFNKLPLSGKLNILTVSIVLLVVVIVAILTLRKPQKTAWTKGLSITAVIVGGLGLLYFVPIFFVLQFSSSPPIQGYPVIETASNRHADSITLNNAQRSNRTLSLSTELSFSEDANFAQAEIVVPVDSESGVQRLAVEPRAPKGTAITSMARRKPTLDGFYAEPVQSSTKVPVNIYLTLQDRAAVPARLNVFYQYWRKNWQWEAMAWIHGKYA